MEKSTLHLNTHLYPHYNSLLNLNIREYKLYLIYQFIKFVFFFYLTLKKLLYFLTLGLHHQLLLI